MLENSGQSQNRFLMYLQVCSFKFKFLSKVFTLEQRAQ